MILETWSDLKVTLHIALLLRFFKGKTNHLTMNFLRIFMYLKRALCRIGAKKAWHTATTLFSRGASLISYIHQLLYSLYFRISDFIFNIKKK